MPPIFGKRAASSSLSSEFDKRPKLELSAEELKRLNKELKQELEEVIPIPISTLEGVESKHLVRAFREVARQTSNVDKSYTDRDVCMGFVERLSTDTRQEFASLWIKAHNDGEWSEFGNYFLLQVAPPTSDRTQELVDNPPRLSTLQSKKATMESWDITYVGNAHDLLYQHIAHYSTQTNYYARYTSIVQSSGMGKSRAIDEFSKKHLVVPLNLRKSLDGFPPPDESVRNWLLQSTTKIEAFNRAGAYLCALFITLLRYLQQIDDHLATIGVPPDGNLATKYRRIMTEGQEFSRQGTARQQFYAEVLELANKIWVPALPTIPPASPKLSLARISGADKIEYDLKLATDALMKFLIKDFNVLNADKPVVVLSFDEAHPLAEMMDSPNGRWSRFFELRRALRMIDLYPCFSLFLSTTGKVNQFMPQPKDDNSNRIEKGLVKVIPPFCELGFDQLAEKVILGETTLDDIASLKFMATLSRPLFAARYIKGDAEVKRSIIMFAAEKLLCRPFPITGGSLSDVEKLACISVRIPLQFSIGYTHSREMEQILVEKHLRVCLQVNPGFETSITIAASEPLLAEASYSIMNETAFDVPRTLLSELEHQGLDKGNRGELIAMVLCLLARDAAAKRLDNRVVPICDFIRELLVPKASSAVLLSKPVQASDPEAANKTFQDTFSKSKMFFNHFVKLHDNEIINRRFLWVLIARGAAGICRHDQIGIDIVIPFLFWDHLLRRENISAILIQCKNNGTFQTVARQYLFDMMHPYHIRFFDEKETTPVPVIRMVFALASPGSDVVVLSRSERTQPPREGAYKASFQADKYTAFDIWCAGAFQTTFGPIKDDFIFQQLLLRSRTFPYVFDNKMSKDLQNAARSMDPASGSHPAHYCNYTSSK